MTHAPLTLGMVGGGNGAFIGAVHRMAARLDVSFTLVAGALCSEPGRARASAAAIGLPPDRAYPDWRTMLAAESKRSDRVDAVSIVTPNSTHAEIARAFIEAGFHIVIDKPMTVTSVEADALVSAVRVRGVVAAVTYNYTGYPLVRHMAHLVRTGAIGAVRKVFVEYHQGWLATKLEESGQKQAVWRSNPALAGLGGAIGDIGSHAENLLAFVTGLPIDAVLADLTRFVPGRRLDDDASVLLRLGGGAKGVLTVSQVCIGEENNLSIRVHGEAGSLAWSQEHPNHLRHATPSGTSVITRAAADSLAARDATRLPPGHPEGFIEAFANIYKGVAEAIRAKREGRTPPATAVFPTVEDGARGVRFIERVVRSAATNTWH